MRGEGETRRCDDLECGGVEVEERLDIENEALDTLARTDSSIAPRTGAGDEGNLTNDRAWLQRDHVAQAGDRAGPAKDEGFGAEGQGSGA